MKEIEVKMQQLQLEQQRLQFESTIAAQQAQMDYQATQEANDARIAESQSRVLAEQTKRDTEMVKLAARREMDMAALNAEISIKQRDQAISEFVAGAKVELDANKQRLTERELKLAENTGEGI